MHSRWIQVPKCAKDFRKSWQESAGMQRKSQTMNNLTTSPCKFHWSSYKNPISWEHLQEASPLRSNSTIQTIALGSAKELRAQLPVGRCSLLPAKINLKSSTVKSKLNQSKSQSTRPLGGWDNESSDTRWVDEDKWKKHTSLHPTDWADRKGCLHAHRLQFLLRWTCRIMSSYCHSLRSNILILWQKGTEE